MERKGGGLLSYVTSTHEGKMPTNIIGDLWYVFRKEFGAHGWFTGTVVKIMKDGDRRCKYSDGDVEDLLLDDLVQLAKLDPKYHHRTKEKKIPIAEKSQPKQKRRKCNAEGCTNRAVKGGVCVTHGAMIKRCSFDGCTNKSKTGGVCITHGSKKKRCSFEGCTNQAINGGVCITHGATVKRCSFEGCANQAQKKGVCVTHGAKKTRKVCTHTGCTAYAQKGGMCRRHPSKRINTNNINPTLQPDAVTSAIPHHLPMNYEDDEEELNSWIWRSSRMGKMC
jgi:hypothetical protein